MNGRRHHTEPRNEYHSTPWSAAASQRDFHSPTFKPAVHEALKDPTAGFYFPPGSIPSDRVKWLDESVPSESIEWAADEVPNTSLGQAKYAIARRNTTQTINNNTVTAISFDTQVADTDGMFAPTSTQITIVTAGLYYVTGQTEWALAGSATTRLLTAIRLNGTDTIAADERTGSTTEAERQNVACLKALVAGDDLELIVFQTNGAAGTRTVTNAGGSYAPLLSAVRIGAS